jgi:hypothetical protein
MTFDLSYLDRNEQEALAVARMDYVSGRNRRTWWHTLRDLGWRSGCSARKYEIELAVDRWIINHPTWCERRMQR